MVDFAAEQKAKRFAEIKAEQGERIEKIELDFADKLMADLVAYFFQETGIRLQDFGVEWDGDEFTITQWEGE